MLLMFLILFIINMQMPPNKELTCLFTQKPVTIDGRLNENVWKRAKAITIEDFDKRTESKMTVRTLWDKDNLYLAFDVQDKDLQSKQHLLDHAQLYMDDMVEFLIDTQNDKDSCWGLNDIVYHINLLGQKKDDRGSENCISDPTWNGHAKYVINMSGTLNDSSDTDTGYILELSISWKELGIKPVVGTTMGINFALGDSGKLFDWVGASPFRAPYAFGNLVLFKGQN